jgi:hypothetical protein
MHHEQGGGWLRKPFPVEAQQSGNNSRVHERHFAALFSRSRRLHVWGNKVRDGSKQVAERDLPFDFQKCTKKNYIQKTAYSKTPDFQKCRAMHLQFRSFLPLRIDDNL